MKKSNNFLVKTVQELWQYRDLLRLLVTRDIKLKYRRSFLGYMWSILNPLLIMVIMTIVFSSMFNRQIENFPVYLFTGKLLFDYMNGSTHQAIYSITGNAALLKKTYVPKYIFTVAKITSGLIDMIFSMGALLIVMIVTRSRFTWHILLVPYVILELYVFCLGLGLFLAQANVFFRDIQYIYNAFTTAWMYLTPLFYPLEALPDALEWCVNNLNPMYFFIGQFRDLIYLNKLPGHLILIAGAVTPILMLLIGLWCFQKSEDRFILYI